MRVLLDTNILTRSYQLNNRQLGTANHAIEFLMDRGDQLFLVPQNLYEIWAVATRPIESNGLGMSTSVTSERVSELLQSVPLLHDKKDLLTIWRQLVIDYEVIGKSTHDARLVAACSLMKSTPFSPSTSPISHASPKSVSSTRLP